MKNNKLIKDLPEVELFNKFISDKPIALAVSGGPDSTAMMQIAAFSKKIENYKVTVLVVDHGLRKESKNEARLVSKNAKLLGFNAKILRWEGTKPKTRIQEIARKTRYRLMTAWCKKEGIEKLFLAHHLDDQVETFLMRLGKGSGVDGLAVMNFLTEISSLQLVRPFLEIPKSRFLDILDHSNLKWISDPSNSNLNYKRSRIREILPILSKEGINSKQIGLVIKRMQSAKNALNSQTKKLLEKYLSSNEGVAYFLDKNLFQEIKDKEILLRVLEKIIMNISGSIYPPRRNKLENILIWLLKENNALARTLNGVVVRKRKGEFIFYREPDDCYKSAVTMPLTTRYNCWDDRFFIKANKSNNFQIRALGNAGTKVLKEKKILKRQGFQNVPLSAWKTAPGIWSKKRLISVPSLGYYKQKDIKIYIKSNNII